MDAITQWYRAGTPEDVDQIERDLFAALDPVQRDVTSRAFRAWRESVGRGGTIGFDAVGPSVVSEDEAYYLTSAIQLTLTDDDGTVEHIKVKLRTPTGEDERAIITLGAEPGIDYLEVILDPGQVDSLLIDRGRAQEVIAELFAMGKQEFDKNDHVGGRHCWWCDRASLCKQYPPLGDSAPPSGTKSLVLGKGTLSRLPECPRRVSWKAIFQFADERSDTDDTSPALAMGNHFHAAIAGALLDADPDGVMRSHALALAASEQSEFLSLWDTHRSLAEAEPDPVEFSRTELPIGCTAPAFTGGEATAVTFLGIVDAGGRESDGTPAIVEHRTTMRRDLPYLEQELYAVAGALAVKSDRIAVHHHWLRSPVDEACTRRLFEPGDLEQARDALVAAAGVIAGWDREDATHAPHVVGEWCAFCPYRVLCTRHRT